jgi:hypothetical protein
MARCSALIPNQRTSSIVYDPDIFRCSGHQFRDGRYDFSLRGLQANSFLGDGFLQSRESEGA